MGNTLQERLLTLAWFAPIPFSTGLKDGVPVPEADQQYVADIMRYGFPEATDEQLLQAVQTRPERASAYK